MDFLGFIISPKGTTDLSGVLLGFCNFYRRFIRNYSQIARLLTALLKGSKNGKKKGDLTKERGDKEQLAFLSLLGSFETAPLLKAL
jgi:hypothetical protein